MKDRHLFYTLYNRFWTGKAFSLGSMRRVLVEAGSGDTFFVVAANRIVLTDP
jgi:hypothetical protein